MSLPIRLAAYAFCVNDGSVLLVQISDLGAESGKWTLPGGGLDPGEHPEDGMHRELFEETGLEGLIRSVLGVDSKVFHDTPALRGDVHSLRIVYEVSCRGVPSVTEVDGTVQAARWVLLSRLDDYPRVNLVQFALQKAGLA